MLSGNVDIDRVILNKLGDEDLVKTCQTNKKAYKICSDETFWLNRIRNMFPYLPLEILRKYKKGRSWSEYYIEDLRKYNKSMDDFQAFVLLMEFARKGRLDHVLIALENGADINGTNMDGETPLVVASGSGDLDTIEYLIKKGADVNASDKYGETALMTASGRGNNNIVEILLKEGAYVNHQSIYGRSALSLANRFGHRDTVRLLQEYR